MSLCRGFKHCRWWLIAATLMFCAFNAGAKETIIWANLHFPPWMILEGTSKGKGVWDELLVYLTEGMPEYEHRMLVMKNVRFEEMARADQHVCKVYYFKTPEREKLLYYSEPSVVFLANHVVMRREKAELLGMPASVSLEKLMSDTRFKGTVINGRSYGKQLDEIIARHALESHISNPVMDNQHLFEYLDLGRTDYIIEFPAVRAFFEFDLKRKPDVVDIAIEEGESYNVTHVACVKNEFGKRVIARVDELLDQRIRSNAHKEATLRWYLPKDQQELDRHYRRILLSPSSDKARK